MMKNLGMGLAEACKGMEITQEEYHKAKKAVQDMKQEALI